MANVLRQRAIAQPHKVACQFIPDEVSDVTRVDWHQGNSWTYSDIDRRARAISKQLRIRLSDCDRQNQPILLAYSPGLEFIAALFGCWYAGKIAVPVQPARRHQSGERWKHILEDAQVVGILTCQHLLPEVKQLIAHHDSDTLFCLATDQLNNLEINDSIPNEFELCKAEKLALLQYTSGSTSKPKGVMVSHSNLMSNQALIYQCFGHGPDSYFVIWLPPHHDMGLIGGILQPIYGGFPVTLMSPQSFLRRPIRWLQAISHFQATTSGGPNFAYDYCLQKTTPSQRVGLNLSSWQLAFNGAEPIQARTLENFSSTFASCGFKSQAFYPCYGLAEATLFVSGNHWDARKNTIRSLKRSSLGLGNVVETTPNSDDAALVIGCGELDVGTSLAIVDLKNGHTCTSNKIGEIWVAGDSITQGYWQNFQATQESFHAYLPDGSGPYLRTGDLGFYDGQSLYITGRLKDLIVIRGRNHLPHDIEYTVAQCHEDLRSQGAAFSVDLDGSESLVIFQEVKRAALRHLQAEVVFNAIRAAVSHHHGLQVAVIWLLKPGHLPQTTSGKVQRHICKTAFIEKKLAPVAHWSINEGQKIKRSKGKESTAFASSKDNLNSLPSDRTNKLAGRISWLRQYANESINSRLMDERRCISPSIVLDFGNQGLLGMQVPQQYGGLEFGHHDLLQVLEQLGAIDPTLALFVGLNNVLGIRPILDYAQPEMREQLLPGLAAGRELAAFALTEPAAGSNPFGITSKAMPTSQGWTLQGEKIWSGSAAWASVTNVFVKQCDATGNPIGVSGFIVKKGSPGLRQGPEALTMGMRAMVQNTVFLDQVPASTSQLLGESGMGMIVAQEAMMYGRLAIAAASVGGMKRCAQMMLRYSSRRSISTGKLLDNPIILTRLNWLTHAITTLNSLVTFVGQRLDQALFVPEEFYAACKVLGPEFYWQAADNLVQCLGGRGYIETNVAPQILRDARVLRIFEGPTESLAMYLGARVTHQPAALREFLSELNLTSLADSLFESASEILAYYLSSQSPFSDEIPARQQANFVIGETAAWALAIATLKATSARPAATEWAQHHFKQAVAQVQVSHPNKGVTATMLAEQISNYQNSIGEIEQTLAGNDEMLDKVLKLTPPSHSSPVEGQTKHLHAHEKKVPPSLFRPLSLKQKFKIEQWLQQWLTQRLRLEQDQIELNKALADYGVDSVMAVELAQDLEDFLALSQPLDVTLAWSFPTIEALSQHLADLTNGAQPPMSNQPMSNPEIANRFSGLDETELSDDLSEAQLAEMLAAELAAVRGR
ncbi:AMP-binding protein [Acaryochloris sp. IP29b_bin.137]|uniref:AMP-binding protein n=1 Tax=Acaryochloris sp. IP29b_bin.137 TaxID=2969217 RepID=UPI0026075EAE|nr:AMP-binding protein [Acaryochloris sp. IP29b_bin.137]